MKMFLVTDDVDARVGLRFAGVEGTLVKNAADAAAAIDAAVADEDVCVLLVTPGISINVPRKNAVRKRTFKAGALRDTRFKRPVRTRLVS